MRKIDLKFPTSWSEITLEHLSIIAKCSLSKLSEKEFLFLLLREFTGIKVLFGMLFIGRKRVNIPVDVIAQACEKLKYIVHDIEPLNVTPLPIDRYLVGVKFEVYYKAEVLISRYQTENNISYLLSAVETLTSGKITKLSKLDPLMINIWWNGVRMYLQRLYPYVLQEGDSDEQSNPFTVLQSLLSTLNQGRPQDNVSILSSDVHSVLTVLNKKMEDYARS